MTCKDQNTFHRLLTAEEDQGIRLDQFLAENTELSRTFCQKLVKAGQVTVNGGVVKKSAYALNENETVELQIPELKSLEILPEDIALNILYEDKDVVVVNKPAGMVVHPDETHVSGTLVNALLSYIGPKELSGIGGVKRPGIVHRLDRDTSGVLIVAKNDSAHQHLSKEIAERKAKKIYQALVFGKVAHENFSIDSPIARDPHNRQKMAVSAVKSARPALTHVTLREVFPNPLCSLLNVRIVTGRTHQIRVHLSSVGYPVVGDETYGNKKQNAAFQKDFPLRRFFLHAETLGITLPNGEYKEFVAPLADDLKETLRMLGYS